MKFVIVPVVMKCTMNPSGIAEVGGIVSAMAAIVGEVGTISTIIWSSTPAGTGIGSEAPEPTPAIL